MSAASPFAVTGCKALSLKPRLAMALTGRGQTTDGRHPGLSATLTQAPGQSNLAQASVTLPLALALDPDNANGLCEPTAAASNTCPSSSIVGSATALSPILAGRLSGPVYFVRGERKDPKTGRTIKSLPKLYVPLEASDYPGLRIDLNADSEVVDEHLVATFRAIPDAPLSRFDLKLTGGAHGVLVVSGTDVCGQNQTAALAADGHSGATSDTTIAMATPCPLALRSSRRTGGAIRMTLGGLGAGTVTVSGTGLKTTRRALASATVATVSVPLTAAGRSRLARGHDLRLTVKVRHAPKGAKARTITRRVVVHAP